MVDELVINRDLAGLNRVVLAFKLVAGVIFDFNREIVCRLDIGSQTLRVMVS